MEEPDLALFWQFRLPYRVRVQREEVVLVDPPEDARPLLFLELQERPVSQPHHPMVAPVPDKKGQTLS